MTPPLPLKIVAIYQKVFWFCSNCAITNNLTKELCRNCKAPNGRKENAVD